MYLPILAQILALAAIVTTSAALPTEASKVSGGTVCNQVGISSARAQQIRKAFDDANLVPEAIKSINPKVSQHRPNSTLPLPSQPTLTINLEPHH